MHIVNGITPVKYQYSLQYSYVHVNDALCKSPTSFSRWKIFKSPWMYCVFCIDFTIFSLYQLSFFSISFRTSLPSGCFKLHFLPHVRLPFWLFSFTDDYIWLYTFCENALYHLYEPILYGIDFWFLISCTSR